MSTPAPNMREVIAGTARELHGGDRIAAARVFVDAFRLPKVKDDRTALEQLNVLLRWCLDRGRLDYAAELLWTPAQFTTEPESVGRIWRAIEQHHFVLLMGASSMGKSYTPGVKFFLEWLRDPYYTVVRAIGPSEDHLQANLFSHLIELHNTASIPLPGKCQDLFIGLNPKNKRGGILGTVLPQGKKSSGRLQGGKRVPRPSPHPTLGEMSRLFVLVDELENVPQGFYQDMENVVSNLQDEADTGFKVVGSFNPKDATKPPYRLSEPMAGWKSFDIDKDYEWRSRAGYHVVRLDAERSENVISGEVRFRGIQTRAGLERLAETSFGKQSPGYYTFGRGAYPILGGTRSMMTESTLSMRWGEPIWLRGFKKVGGADLALEGGDAVRFAHGRFGLASAVRLPDGKLFRFENSKFEVEPRTVVVLDGIRNLPKGDTTVNAREIRAICSELGIEPECLMVDRTGVGAGTHDVLRSFWSPLVRGVNYSEGATDTKVFDGDTQTAKEEYLRVVSELWFAFRRLAEHGCLWFAPSFMNSSAKPLLWEQLTGRLYDPNRSNRVETKAEYKSRGNTSPDEADAATVFVHCVRAVMGNPFTIGRPLGGSKDLEASAATDIVSMGYTDLTNKIDHLESDRDDL